MNAKHIIENVRDEREREFSREGQYEAIYHALAEELGDLSVRMQEAFPQGKVKLHYVRNGDKFDGGFGYDFDIDVSDKSGNRLGIVYANVEYDSSIIVRWYKEKGLPQNERPEDLEPGYVRRSYKHCCGTQFNNDDITKRIFGALAEVETLFYLIIKE